MDAAPAPPACIAEASDILRIQADGAISYQGQILTMADLKNRLEVEKVAGVRSAIVITASDVQDGMLQYGQLTELLDLLRQMDRVKIGLVTGETR